MWQAKLLSPFRLTSGNCCRLFSTCWSGRSATVTLCPIVNGFDGWDLAHYLPQCFIYPTFGLQTTFFNNILLRQQVCDIDLECIPISHSVKKVSNWIKLLKWAKIPCYHNHPNIRLLFSHLNRPIIMWKKQIRLLFSHLNRPLIMGKKQKKKTLLWSNCWVTKCMNFRFWLYPQTDCEYNVCIDVYPGVWNGRVRLQLQRAGPNKEHY